MSSLRTGLVAIIALITAVLLLPDGSYADLYQWTDKDGVLHITDDMGKVPEDVRWRVKIFKTTPAEKGEAEPYWPAEEVVPAERKADLYGDHTLEWWLNTFRKLSQKIQAVEGRIAARKQYINVFEGGRRFGQIYGDEEVERYNEFKKGIPLDEAELSGLNEELQELRRKATIHGVPREIRGE